MSSAPHRLLQFARELQRAATFGELLLTTRDEVEASLGYRHAWVCILEDEGATEVRLLDVAGALRGKLLELCPLVPIAGDAMVEEIMRGESVVVVEDARTDPRTNKAIVAALGNRTIVNVALRLVDQPLGVLGLGTFGDEGCHAPTPEQLDHLLGMASQLSVAAARIRLGEERRRSEEALKRAEERASESRKMEAIGRLAGSIAHDFNNLLSIIIGYAADLADDPLLGPTRSASVDAIRGAADRAAELTRQLLAYARRQVLAPRVVDPNGVVLNLERILRRLMVDTIDVRVELARDVWPIEVDPTQLEQVLMNLTLNARDAMPGGGRLLVETRNVEVAPDEALQRDFATAGPHVLLAVSDTGTGMTAEVKARIFEPFFTTKADGAGTGLGLATVFGIVKQSGGTLVVDSEPGRGSAFEVYFPRSRAHTATAAVAPAPTASAHGVILVVEDEPQVREVATRVLERQGYRVLAASSGAEALALAEQHAGRIDLLLSDVVMRPMGGRDLAERLRATRPETRVLFMSGYTESAVVHHGIVEPGLAYLAKPFTPELLARAVGDALRDGGASRG